MNLSDMLQHWRPWALNSWTRVHVSFPKSSQATIVLSSSRVSGPSSVFGDVSTLLVSVDLSGRAAQPLRTPADGGRAVGSVLHLLVFAAELHRLPR